MLVVLSKREYDELVQKATAVDLLAEKKAEEMKEQIIKRLHEILNGCQTVSPHLLAEALRQVLQHY